jgi:hypothetical protein
MRLWEEADQHSQDTPFGAGDNSTNLVGALLVRSVYDDRHRPRESIDTLVAASPEDIVDSLEQLAPVLHTSKTDRTRCYSQGAVNYDTIY